jgi:3-isopropylmalate/(R)-2-methylmalate dehydratase small subunit
VTRAIESIEGRAWALGDDIDTDLLAPGHTMRMPIEELSRHCLEAVAPEFASRVQRGDVLVGGSGFGIGSSREQAVQALLYLGVAAVLARSIARIFYRNALNLGLPVLVFPDAATVKDGERLRIEPARGFVHNVTTGTDHRCEAIPDFLMDMLRDGGLMPHLHKRLRRTLPGNP